MDGKAVELFAVLIAFGVFLITCVKGEIRCYCNVAPCVSTSYMCKSGHFCFSDVQSGVHGCLDRRRCTPGLQCCQEDMCNYMHVDPITGPLEAESERTSMLESSMMQQREVWFRAAVIAVPIGGVCVLAVLVAAAVRMLRQDMLRQKRIHELRRGMYGYSLGDSLLPWNKDSTVV